MRTVDPTLRTGSKENTMDRESERYEVEIMVAECADSEHSNYDDLDEAMSVFYKSIGENYSEPSYNIAVHDLVAGRCLANWWYDPDDEVGKVLYDCKTPVLGN